MNAQESAHYILVDLDSENQRDLLGDAGTSPAGISPLHGNHGINEVFVWSLRARSRPAFRRKQDAVLSFAQDGVEMQQSGRFQNNSGAENTGPADEKRAQPGDDPINHAQVGRTLAPAIENQQLMPDQHGLGHNGTESTWPCQSRHRHNQMNE